MINSVRWLYLRLRHYIMARGGLEPRDHYWCSLRSRPFNGEWVRGSLVLPNPSGSYHGVLRNMWETCGLGDRCLLVSESREVGSCMHARYPKTEFVTANLFAELHGESGEHGPDVVWDVCSTPPSGLHDAWFTSVISHALVEHVIDPTSAIANMLSMLRGGGCLYLMRATPSFHLHRYPRDYVRFHLDYFEDIPAYVKTKKGLEVELEEMYAKDGIVCVCYRRCG